MAQKLINQLENLLVQVPERSYSPGENGEMPGSCSMELANFALIEKCIINILEDRNSQMEIFSNSFRPALGHVFSLLLDLFTDTKVDVNLRLRAGKLLCLLTQPEFGNESADLIAFIFPGIFSKCRTILTGSSAELHSLDIVRCSCQLVINIFTVSFSNIEVPHHDQNQENGATYNKGNSIFCFKRGTEWAEMAKGKILPQISLLLSQLCLHPTDVIRFEAINMLAQIQKVLKSDELIRTTVDLCIILFKDPFQRTSFLAKQLLDDVQQQNKQLFESHIMAKLSKTIETLENDVKNSADGRIYLKNLTNLIQIMGVDLLTRLLNLPDFVHKMLMSITNIIGFEYQRELVSDTYEQNPGCSINFPPLRHGLDILHFTTLAEALIVTENTEVLLDWIYEQFQSCVGVKRRTSLAYFTFTLLTAMRDNTDQASSSSSIHQEFVEDILKILGPLESMLEREVSDHKVEQVPVANSEETCLAQVLVSCLSTLHSRDDFKSTRVLVDVMYELLKWCSSSNFGIKRTSEYALNRLAEIHSHPDVSSFIRCHAQQIVFKLTLNSRDFSMCPFFPRVFAEMVSKCNDPDILPQIRSIVDELLTWLDRSDQRKTIMLLRAIDAYLRTLLKWHPEMKPPSPDRAQISEEEEDEDGVEKVQEMEDDERKRKQHAGDSNYPLIKDTVSILNRTKHFLNSPHLPIMVVILDILINALQFVRHYEDELLPMVHQNWHGLIRTFDVIGVGPKWAMTDFQKIVMTKAIEVITCMCQLTGDFVYWKIVQEFIPRISKLAQDLLESNRNMGRIYAQTATYKLQCAIMDSIPIIVKTAKISPKHYQELEEMITVYAKEPKLASELKGKAENALEFLKRRNDIETFEKDEMIVHK